MQPAWAPLQNLPGSPPAGDEVWVFSVSTAPGPHLDGLGPLLDDYESQRAGRLRSARARAEFVNGRGFLRLLLGGLLGHDPRGVRLATAGNGKPVLAETTGLPLFFNIAHSHGMGLLAVASHAELGVDIERLRDVTDRASLARRYFHPSEVICLEGLTGEAQQRLGFFHAWTRKEAFLKATAVGIGFGLDRVEVTLEPGHPARLLRIDGCEQTAAPWTLEHLEPGEGWLAALALRAPCGKLVTAHADLAKMME